MIKADPLAVHPFWLLAKGAQLPALKKSYEEMQRQYKLKVRNKEHSNHVGKKERKKNIEIFFFHSRGTETKLFLFIFMYPITGQKVESPITEILLVVKIVLFFLCVF